MLNYINFNWRICSLLCFYFLVSCPAFCFQQTDTLEIVFKNPPIQSRPYVWWHWMGSNYSTEGITKDLEAMHAAGIGGATIFNLSSAVQESHAPTLNNPWPEKTYRSKAYWGALKHAAAEAKKLGIELGLHNTVGYSTTGGPWIDEARSMQRLVWCDTVVSGGQSVALVLPVPNLVADEGWGKTGRKVTLFNDIAVLAVPDGKPVIKLDDVKVLEGKPDASGKLEWIAPLGNWRVYRLGHASTGRPPHPVPDDLLGKVLEADKMSHDISTFHWNTLLAPLKENLGEHLGNSFKHMLIDSYEAGVQNWTKDFRNEFIKLKGYDPLPWLATFSLTVGTEPNSKDRRFINSREATARFDWDYRDVIEQLFTANGWQVAKQLLAREKLDLQFEPYGGPFNTPQSVALSDLPMAEFWTAGVGGIDMDVVAAARGAGKRVIGAEAFTGRPEVSQYTEDPAFLKRTADVVFSQGINRMILHHWVHQPFDDKYQPGMGMGWWGTHFGRHQTWFEPGKAFFKYLARCQAMLQYGVAKAPYLCIGERQGNGDLIAVRDFLNEIIQVKDGKLALSSGLLYDFLVFPRTTEMLPEVALKMKELIAKGALVVAVKPEASPGLQNYPACDVEVMQIGQQIWRGKYPYRYGKGIVLNGIEEAIDFLQIKPAVVLEQAIVPGEIKTTHRSSAEYEVYFVANTDTLAQQAVLLLKHNGKTLPQLWDPVNGSIKPLPVWQKKDNFIRVWLPLQPLQAIFVVFGEGEVPKNYWLEMQVIKGKPDIHLHQTRSGKNILYSQQPAVVSLIDARGSKQKISLGSSQQKVMSGTWRVRFSPKLDVPFEITMDSLKDFSLYNDTRIKYFAGTAVYAQQIELNTAAIREDSRAILDLGEMHDIAVVKVNGKQAGVLWYPPYRIDVTEYVQSGSNAIEIEVTNNWANRLIGDEQYPEDFEWGSDRGEKLGRAILAYPEWFLHNSPRPSKERKTFSIWHYYKKNSPLQPAGLTGPVRIHLIKAFAW
ncbi:MAG: hypothetical protein EAY75_18050 [Bacteroidetes bacterium]|nr:MAG: hypothetical protein EAY75_18050 [Bacteroidota bacterium]